MAVVPGAFTQSGYPVIADYGAPELDTSAAIDGVKFPGGIRTGDVTTILLYVAHRWHTDIEPLRKPDKQYPTGQCWGYDRRDIRGGTGWSNHAGGCAIDTNAALHPQHTRTLSQAQIDAAHRILGDVSSAVRWGGDWSTASLDQQHWEILPGAANTGAVAALAAKIHAGDLPNVPRALLIGKRPAKGGAVRRSVKSIQKALNATGAGLVVDGIAGPKTTAAIRAFQQSHGLTVDGIVGAVTWATLRLAELQGSLSDAARDHIRTAYRNIAKAKTRAAKKTARTRYRQLLASRRPPLSDAAFRHILTALRNVEKAAK